MNRIQMIEFSCPFCHEELEVNPRAAGKEKLCPACDSLIRLPAKAETPPAKKSVKVSIGFPGLGGMKARVSKKDAGKLAFTFLGAMIAIVGVLLGVKLKPPSA